MGQKPTKGRVFYTILYYEAQWGICCSRQRMGYIAIKIVIKTAVKEKHEHTNIFLCKRNKQHGAANQYPMATKDLLLHVSMMIGYRVQVFVLSLREQIRGKSDMLMIEFPDGSTYVQ